MVTSERQPVGAEMAASPFKEKSLAKTFAPPAKVNNVGPKKGPTQLPPSVQRERNRIDSLARSPPNTERPPSWISKMAGSVSTAFGGTLGSNTHKESEESKSPQEESEKSKWEPSSVYSVCFRLELNPEEKFTSIEPDFEMDTQEIDEVASRAPSVQSETTTQFNATTSDVSNSGLFETESLAESSPGWFKLPNVWQNKEETDKDEKVSIGSPTDLHTLRFSSLFIDKSGSFFWEWNDGGIIDEQTCKIARFLGLEDDYDDYDECEEEEEFITKGITHDTE